MELKTNSWEGIFMSRKNIFQLVEENYDVQSEIKKINMLFNHEEYFEEGVFGYSLKDLIEKHLFSGWKYRGTCLDVKEYFTRADATIMKTQPTEEDNIINYLEVVENFIKLYFDNSTDLYNEYEIEYFNEFNTVFCELINTLEKRMGLTTREYKDRIIIYPKNASLEKVVELCEDEDVQWELIRYVRENLSLSEKRKVLAYLATNLYIEEDSNEQDEHLKAVIKKAGNILNNLHIRHNNKTGKWENIVLDEISDEDAISLCDMVYNEMLIIVLLREHKKYDDIYDSFKLKQKISKNSRKTT